MNKPAHYRCASVPGNYLRWVSYSCLILMGKWLEGGKPGRKQSVWCLFEDRRKAFCLPGGYSVSGHTAQQAASTSPSAGDVWGSSIPDQIALQRGSLPHSGEASCYLSSQNAHFKYAHHRAEHSSHVGDGWGWWVNRLTNHPLVTQRHPSSMPTQQKRHRIPPHTNCKFLWNHPFETSLRYAKHNWQKLKPRDILERPSESLSSL